MLYLLYVCFPLTCIFQSFNILCFGKLHPHHLFNQKSILFLYHINFCILWPSGSFYDILNISFHMPDNFFFDVFLHRIYNFLFRYYFSAFVGYFIFCLHSYLHSIVHLKFSLILNFSWGLSLYLNLEYYPLFESCLLICLSFLYHYNLLLTKLLWYHLFLYIGMFMLGILALC